MAGGCSAAKPLWSEVMIFLDDFLRQGRPLPEDIASSDERCAHRKTECAGYLSSGERLFAGGGLRATVVRRSRRGRR